MDGEGRGQNVKRRLRAEMITPQQVHHWRSRALSFLEYYWAYGMGTVFGISSVVRYLRNPNPFVSAKLLRAFGARVGNHATIKRSLMIDNVYGDTNSTGDFSHLKIGNNCYIGDCVFFDLASEIIIEDNAVISAQASFITHAECKRSSFIRQRFPRKCAPVIVGSGAWVGFGVTLLSGVTIGPNAVIGAHALLLQDAEPGCVYVGAPARKLKQIEETEALTIAPG